jgi:hypothetical protein
MAKGALVIAAAAALVAVVLGRGQWREMAARLGGRQPQDPTIAQVPESRMPVTAQATVGPSTGAQG